MKFSFSTLLTTVTLLILSFARVAAAEDSWRESVSFSRADRASLKIVEPEGYKVAVGSFNDTAPTVVAVDNADGYYAVTLTAPTGATWTKKIEVKRGQTTELRVQHVKANASTPATPSRSHVGRVRNTFPKCPAKKAGVLATTSVRADFVNTAGAVAASIQVDAAAPQKDAEVPAGDYAFRTYIWNPKDKTWTFLKTLQVQIGKDGWIADIGCNNDGSSASFK